MLKPILSYYQKCPLPLKHNPNEQHTHIWAWHLMLAQCVTGDASILFVHKLFKQYLSFQTESKALFGRGKNSGGSSNNLQGYIWLWIVVVRQRNENLKTVDINITLYRSLYY